MKQDFFFNLHNLGKSIRILLHSLLVNDTATDLKIGGNLLKWEGIKYIAIYISQVHIVFYACD